MTREDDPDEGVEPTEPGDGESVAGDEDDAGEWKFAVEDVGPGGVTEDTATPEHEPIEPGDVTLEHAVFVALGVVITVGTFVFGF